MWAVCYGVNGGALMFGRIIGEGNAIITVEDRGRETWKESGWNADYVEKYKTKKEAKKAFEKGYRTKWSLKKPQKK